MKWIVLLLALVCCSSFAGTVASMLDDGIPVSASSITPTAGKLWYANGTSFVALPIGSTGNVLKVVGGLPAWGTVAGSGTVTSVDQSFTGGLISVSGNPITGAGTLALTVAGTSGGIPYFSGASTWASSAALASNSCVFGGGAGTSPASQANAAATATFLNNGGTSGTAFTFNTTNTYGVAQKLVEVKNAGTTKLTLDRLGALTTVGSVTGSLFIAASLASSGDYYQQGNGAQVTAKISQDGGLNGTLLINDSGGNQKVFLDGSNGNVTATTFIGALTGNASTATTLGTLGTTTTILHGNAAGAPSYSALVNADVSATAAIAGTKIAPDFGSQAVTTSGNIGTTGGNLVALSTLNATGNNPFNIVNTGITDGAGATAFTFNTTNALADGAALIVDFKNGSTSKATITRAGLYTGTLAVGSVTGLGTGVATALAVNTNSAGGFSPIDGTATFTNKTISLTSNTLTFTSAQLATACSNETGSGALVFGTSPDFTTGITIASVAVPTISSTSTITNKWIQPRITTIVSNANPTINTDNCDCVTITAQAAAITSMTTNLSGTPVNFQKLIIRILDDGSNRAITWGTSYVGTTTVALPTTTAATKVLTVGLIWDSSKSKWVCHATTQD